MNGSGISSGVLALVAILATSYAAAAPQGRKEPNKDKSGTVTPQAQAVQNLGVASQLAKYGEQNKDPLALILAAKMKLEAGQAAGTHKRESSKSLPGSAKEESKAEKPTSTPQRLLETAKGLAGGRADLVALADEAGKSVSRGAARGPQEAYERVNARKTDSYTIRFRGGEAAVVVLSGDGDTDLDLTVHDENGNLICASEGAGDDEACRFYPSWTGPFVIRVINYGRVYNQYYLATN
jgi:hypothetical protein